MEPLSKISPSTSVVNKNTVFTPKRSLISRVGTPVQFGRKPEGVKESTALRNPFDVKAESLYLHSCSPSIFATFQRSKKDDGSMPWSIEHLSVLYPADIDETSLPDPWLDDDQEQQAQKAIDTFFSQNSIVPSPWSSSPKDGKIKSRRRAIMTSELEDVQSCEASTQTMLSIPPQIDLKKILGNFFTCDDDESPNSSKDDSDFLSSSSLRRKLFANDEDFSSPYKSEYKGYFSSKRKSTATVYMRSAQSTPASDVLSSSPISPPNCSDSCNIISSPPISPISAAHVKEDDESLSDSYRENMHKTPLKRLSLDETTEESVMSFCMAHSQESKTSDNQDTGYATVSIDDNTNPARHVSLDPQQRGLSSDPAHGDDIFRHGSMDPQQGVLSSDPAHEDDIFRHVSMDPSVPQHRPSDPAHGDIFRTKPVPTRSSLISSSNVDESITSRHFGYVSRITPVEEFMDDCELSSDMSYQNTKGPDDMSMLEYSRQEQNGYSWGPTCCSTPAKCSHS